MRVRTMHNRTRVRMKRPKGLSFGLLLSGKGPHSGRRAKHTRDAIRTIVQENALKRQFEESLFPNMLFRIVPPDPFPGLTKALAPKDPEKARRKLLLAGRLIPAKK